MSNILDRNFRYYDSDHTNLRRTFARERKRLRERAGQRKAEVVPTVPVKVPAVIRRNR